MDKHLRKLNLHLQSLNDKAEEYLGRAERIKAEVVKIRKIQENYPELNLSLEEDRHGRFFYCSSAVNQNPNLKYSVIPDCICHMGAKLVVRLFTEIDGISIYTVPHKFVVAVENLEVEDSYSEFKDWKDNMKYFKIDNNIIVAVEDLLVRAIS